jgi:hypothetical protein
LGLLSASNAIQPNKSNESPSLSNAATAASSSNSNSVEDFENMATLESIVKEKMFPTDASVAPVNGTTKESPFQEPTSTTSSLPIPPEAVVSKKVDPIEDTRTTIGAAEVISTDEDASAVFPPLPPFAPSMPYEVPAKANRAEKRQSVGDRRRYPNSNSPCVCCSHIMS